MTPSHPEPEDNLASTSPPLGKEEIAVILQQHRLWLDSGERDGRRAVLKNANLKGAVLIGAILRRADLEGANLYGAYLKKADLEEANLRHANLRGANVRWANFRNADLESANLVRGDFRETVLDGANLKGANLKMAEGLKREWLDRAHTDPSTRLPDPLS
ncbi:MAG: hypothetical protein COV67_14875 [Nitrospinae bacterium CG11_big_fil_rev_8_21_14_0_20_56_8]|nr:MAG: hypothetical protein COV67_14875 [Nitrospinae bacterium CG11_big_fil_rev_8_21_14_0_20_56_8]